MGGVSSSTTLTVVACKMIFRQMFFSNKRLNQPSVQAPKAFTRSVKLMLDACLDPTQRWELPRATQNFTALLAEYGGAACSAANKERTTKVIERAYIKRRDHAAQRCEKRYC